MNTFLILLACFVMISKASLSPGLRGVIIYTYDQSFNGADLQVVKLDPNTLNKLLGTKEFIIEPKPISSASAFVDFLDGRCDVSLKCQRTDVVQNRCEVATNCQSKCKECKPLKCKECKTCDKTTVVTKFTTHQTQSVTNPTKSVPKFRGSTYLPPSKPTRPSIEPWTGTYVPNTATYSFSNKWTHPTGHTYNTKPYVAINTTETPLYHHAGAEVVVDLLE